MKKLFLFALLFTMSNLLVGCSIFSDKDSDPYKGKSEKEIYSTAETQLGKENYGHAVKAYEALDTYYPFGPDSQQAQLDVIYAYYKYNDPVSALAAANRYIHLYPEDNKVSYAYYMKAVTLFSQDQTFAQRYFPINMSARDLSNAKKSYADFAQVIRMYPDSPYAVDAKQRMIYLRNAFAEHDIWVAKFYFIRQDYIASANRANNVMQHYQGTPWVEDALVMMVKSYDELGLSPQADTSYQLLTLNYPNSQQLKDLQKWRKENDKS